MSSSNAVRHTACQSTVDASSVPHLVRSVSFGEVPLDRLTHVLRHVAGQFVRLIVRYGIPIEDLVELDDDARLASFVAELIGLGALVAEGADLEFAELVSLQFGAVATRLLVFTVLGIDLLVLCRKNTAGVRQRTVSVTKHRLPASSDDPRHANAHCSPSSRVAGRFIRESKRQYVDKLPFILINLSQPAGYRNDR